MKVMPFSEALRGFSRTAHIGQKLDPLPIAEPRLPGILMIAVVCRVFVSPNHHPARSAAPSDRL